MQHLHTIKKEENNKGKLLDVSTTIRIPRPKALTGVTYKVDSPSGRIFITVNHNEKGDLFEIFINCGKNGSDIMALAHALGRTISFALRMYSPVPIQDRVREIVSELRGLGGSRSIGFGENMIRSLPDAVAITLSSHCNLE